MTLKENIYFSFSRVFVRGLFLFSFQLYANCVYFWICTMSAMFFSRFPRYYLYLLLHVRYLTVCVCVPLYFIDGGGSGVVSNRFANLISSYCFDYMAVAYRSSSLRLTKARYASLSLTCGEWERVFDDFMLWLAYWPDFPGLNIAFSCFSISNDSTKSTSNDIHFNMSDFVNVQYLL